MKRLSVVLLLALVQFGPARADELEVIQLKYRTAEQVIPTLRPLVEPGGGLSGMQTTLVIRASRTNIAQLRQVVANLDTLPRRLMISVRQDAGGGFAQRGAGVSGTVGGGDVRVGVNELPRPQSGVTVGAYDSRSTADDRMTSQVQALEGSPAYIATGQSAPVRSTVITSAPSGGSVVQSTMTYQNVASGFYVIPRVSGDRVFLDIAPQGTTPGQQGAGSANYQQIVTTASGRLGEWFQLGGIDQSAAGSQSGILSGSSGTRSVSSSVWVRVDEIR
ncbi:MAG TPA: secretin N-terminal domain-containing protein [Burkholderiales bacterium]|nr:secretin N-terminal domain-containing protein [Burkholderiales bacterium]